MEMVILLILLVVGWNIYKAGHRAGKHLGSRKAYGVGFDRGRRSRRQQNEGCGSLVLVLACVLALAGWLLAR